MKKKKIENEEKRARKKEKDEESEGKTRKKQRIEKGDKKELIRYLNMLN